MKENFLKNLYFFTDKDYYNFFNKEKKINNIIMQHENLLLIFLSCLFSFCFFGFLTAYIYTNYIFELFSLSFFSIFIFVSSIKKTFENKRKIISRRIININTVLFYKIMEKRINKIENSYTEEEKYIKDILGDKVKNLKEIRKQLKLKLLSEVKLIDILENFILLEKINPIKLYSKIYMYRNDLTIDNWNYLINSSKNIKIKRKMEKERAKALFLLKKII